MDGRKLVGEPLPSSRVSSAIIGLVGKHVATRISLCFFNALFSPGLPPRPQLEPANAIPTIIPPFRSAVSRYSFSLLFHYQRCAGKRVGGGGGGALP